jgi:hypothetical protein
MDWLSARVSSGFFAVREPVDDAALLADIAQARGVFEQIKLETVPEVSSRSQAFAALLVLFALRGRRPKAGISPTSRPSLHRTLR